MIARNAVKFIHLLLLLSFLTLLKSQYVINAGPTRQVCNREVVPYDEEIPGDSSDEDDFGFDGQEDYDAIVSDRSSWDFVTSTPTPPNSHGVERLCSSHTEILTPPPRG